MTNESPLVRVTTRTCAKRHASRMASIFYHDKNPYDTIEPNLTIRLSLTSPWAHPCHTNAANLGLFPQESVMRIPRMDDETIMLNNSSTAKREV